MLATRVTFHAVCDLCEQQLPGSDDMGAAILEAAHLGWEISLTDHDGRITGTLYTICPA